MRRNRFAALVGSATLAGAGVLGGAGIAQAQQDEGPVQFNAVGNDQCEVTFTIENRTNSEDYTVDYMIDDEFANWKTDKHYSVTRFALSSKAEAPLWGGGIPYVSDREPVVNNRTIDLKTVENLPNPDSDTHTISYRLIRGPHVDHRDDDNVYTTDVSGCADGGSGGLVGSIIGSVDVFGSLGTLSDS